MPGLVRKRLEVVDVFGVAGEHAQEGAWHAGGAGALGAAYPGRTAWSHRWGALASKACSGERRPTRRADVPCRASEAQMAAR